MSDIDTADMRAMAIIEEDANVLYRMVKRATDEIDALRAKLEAVEALHRPVTYMVLAWECDGENNPDPTCQHEDECPWDTPLTVCGHCDEIREIANDLASCENTLWPCATARAISGPVDDA